MPLLNWHEEYTVHNEELDCHHRKLFSILNSLYDDCLQVDSENCVGPRLNELLDFAAYHFKAEEDYMRRIEYFEIDDHIEMHNGFVFKLEEIRSIPHRSELETTRELIVFIGKWLLQHVLDEDRKYALHASK
jgi:hemerythrin-like metal-binding protein